MSKYKYLPGDKEKKYPIKKGWVIYHKDKDKFLVQDREGKLKWSEGFDELPPKWFPAFCHTQRDVFRIFSKGCGKMKWYKKFDLGVYRGVVLVNAEGNEELNYVDSTNFGWVVPAGRFDRHYTMRYGTPEIEKWL